MRALAASKYNKVSPLRRMAGPRLENRIDDHTDTEIRVSYSLYVFSIWDLNGFVNENVWAGAPTFLQRKTPPIFMGRVSNHINSDQNWVGSMCQISLAY